MTCRPLLLVLGFFVAACSSDDAPKPAGSAGSTAGSGGTQCDTQNGKFVIQDDTNYTLPTSLAVELVTLRSNTDLSFDWGALTQDFYGRKLDPAGDIGMILLSLWAMTPEELRQRLERDQLPRSQNIGAITAYPEGSTTSENLLGFNLQGNPIPEEELWAFFDTEAADYQYPQDRYTFMAMASSGTVLARNARMLAFFNLAPDAAATELAFTNDSTRVDYEVHLAGARPVRVPVATPGITIDWSEMLTNALGNEYLPAQITLAAVAHFSTSSLAELESDFLNLREHAAGWWEAKVEAGQSIELGTLVDGNQSAFPGIGSDGTWLVALFCTTGNCNHPAPWSLTILKPCD
jgi:hypothetical protein